MSSSPAGKRAFTFGLVSVLARRTCGQWLLSRTCLGTFSVSSGLGDGTGSELGRRIGRGMITLGVAYEYAPIVVGNLVDARSAVWPFARLAFVTPTY